MTLCGVTLQRQRAVRPAGLPGGCWQTVQHYGATDSAGLHRWGPDLQKQVKQAQVMGLEVVVGLA